MLLLVDFIIDIANTVNKTTEVYDILGCQPQIIGLSNHVANAKRAISSEHYKDKYLSLTPPFINV